MAMALGLVGLSLATAAQAAPPPPRLPREPTLRVDDITGPRLERYGDGTLRHVDPQARFVGVIHPDGRVELRDIPDARVDFTTGVRTVDWMLGFVRAIEAPQHDRPDLETPTPAREDARARLEAKTELVPNGPYGPPPILVSVGGSFGGIGDVAIRQHQRRQSRAKQAFLDSTAPLRATLARKHAEEGQRAAQARLGRELAALWHDETRSLAERRRELFQRWDDCEEASAGDPTTAPGDAPEQAAARSEADVDRSRGGEAMRRRIEAFVRHVAPAGSPQAFAPEELSRLNAARRSRQRFDPYGRARDAARDDIVAR